MGRARVVPPGAWSRVVYLNVVTLRTRIPKLAHVDLEVNLQAGTAVCTHTGVHTHTVPQSRRTRYLRGSGRITILQLGRFRAFWRARDVGGA